MHSVQRCKTVLSQPLLFKFGPKHNQQEESLFTCPINFIDTCLFEYWRLYSHYKSGFLAAAGGIGQQPARYVMAMEIIKGEVAKIEEEKLAKQQRKGKR